MYDYPRTGLLKRDVPFRWHFDRNSIIRPSNKVADADGSSVPQVNLFSFVF